VVGHRERHGLARTGKRQLDAAVNRIAVTQKRCHPEAAAYLQRRTTRGDTQTEALRALRRRLSDIVDPAPLADPTPTPGCLAEAA
jgi:transposase